MTCSSNEFHNLLKNTLSRHFHLSVYDLSSLIFLAFASFLPEAGGKLILNCLKYMMNVYFFSPVCIFCVLSVLNLMMASVSSVSGLPEVPLSPLRFSVTYRISTACLLCWSPVTDHGYASKC